MALKYWFPMTDGTLHNQGLSTAQFTSTNYSSSNEGKLGKCIKTNNNTIESGMTSTDWIGENGATLCGWFKFPESEIQSYIDNYSTTHTTMYGTLMGFNSYNGLALSWTATKPYTNFIVHSPVRNGNSLYIVSYSLKDHNLMNKWVHLACIMDLPNKQISLYINGELFKTTITTDITTIPKYPFKMNMKQVYGGNGQTLSIPYYCNDIRVYDEPISPSEIKRISQGLLLHYSLSNRGFGNENLLTRYVTPGQASPTSTATAGRTKYYGDYGIIIPAQESADTYFRLFLKEQLTLNEVYTISCQASGLLNGSYIRFPLFAQGNTSMGILNIDHNGLCSLTFTMTYTNQTAATAGSETVYICFLDDAARNYVSGQGAITLTNFKIEKGNKVTPFIPSSSDPLYSKLELDNNIEYDLSGYQYNGIRSGVTPSSDTARNFGATYFDGVDDMILINDLYISSKLNDCATISFWIKPDGEDGARSVYFSAYSNTSWSIEKSTANTIRSWWNGSPDLNCSNAVITDGVWQHVCIVKNGSSNLKVYINGELKYTQGGYTFENKTFSTTWRIGRDTRSNDGTPYHGLMTDFRLYSTALSADEIADLYGGGGSA